MSRYPPKPCTDSLPPTKELPVYQRIFSLWKFLLLAHFSFPWRFSSVFRSRLWRVRNLSVEFQCTRWKTRQVTQPWVKSNHANQLPLRGHVWGTHPSPSEISAPQKSVSQKVKKKKKKRNHLEQGDPNLVEPASDFAVLIKVSGCHHGGQGQSQNGCCTQIGSLLWGGKKSGQAVKKGLLDTSASWPSRNRAGSRSTFNYESDSSGRI